MAELEHSLEDLKLLAERIRNPSVRNIVSDALNVASLFAEAGDEDEVRCLKKDVHDLLKLQGIIL